jgi:phage tail protein X
MNCNHGIAAGYHALPETNMSTSRVGLASMLPDVAVASDTLPALIALYGHRQAVTQ